VSVFIHACLLGVDFQFQLPCESIGARDHMLDGRSLLSAAYFALSGDLQIISLVLVAVQEIE
jgi:hypothetical protein